MRGVDALPAEAQQYRHGGHQPWCGPECTTMHYPPVPAETQQDDARTAAQVADEYNIAHLLHTDGAMPWEDARANAERISRYLAARAPYRAALDGSR